MGKKEKKNKKNKKAKKLRKKRVDSKKSKLGGKKEFKLGDNPPKISSSELLKINDNDEDILSLRILSEEDAPRVKKAPPRKLEESAESAAEKSDPIFMKLAEPKLPALPKEDRARLQMQSPTRLYFYWSIKNNPYRILDRAFGGRTGSYILVAKLVNRTTGSEEIFPVEAEGNWWFNVKSDSSYRAEIGFYAPNRPYIRVVFSNELQTPRKSPSKRTDYTPSFNVKAYEFAEALDVAGYQRDAIEVAIAGDDFKAAEDATGQTYAQLVGKDTEKFERGNGDELRFALLAIASGYSLEDIRTEIGSKLYHSLKEDIDQLTPDRVLGALRDDFDIFTEELIEQEEIGNGIFGASLVNFPKRIRKRNVPKSLLPKLSSLSKSEAFSSFSLGIK